MYPYNWIQWLLFFYFYCFAGWCIESTIVSVKEKRVINRGFLHGPVLPIYGTGAIMVLICTIPVRENIVLVYFFGMIGATVLEYITGWGMEKIFKVRYWDYSQSFLNLNGHICLVSSLFWGVLSIFMTDVVQEPVEGIILSLSNTVSLILAIVITVVFAADLYVSLKAALDLAKFLGKMQEIRVELEELAEQIREDAMRAVKERSAETIGNMVEYSIAMKENIKGLPEKAKEKQAFVMNFLKELPQETKLKLPDGWSRQELAEQLFELQEEKRSAIIERLKSLQGERTEVLKKVSGGERKRLIRRHPSAISVRFKEAFEEVKITIEEKRNQKDKKEKENS